MITRRLFSPTGAFKPPSSWTCPSCTRASFVRPAFSQQRRGYRVAELPSDASFKEYGVPGLLSPQGYALAWTQYQSMMVRKLNELTAGQPTEGADPKTLAIQFARDPMNASLFNHASMAFNNHFFFHTLSTSPMPLPQCPELSNSLVQGFGSIETLRSTFLNTAAAMFGPGFVWLVWSRHLDATSHLGGRNGSWKILATYLAGTPYPEAGYRQQSIDMNTNNASTWEKYRSQQPANTVGAFGALSRSGKDQAGRPPGGAVVHPVMCVNAWEHVYIYDYGLAGKRKYLEDWWNALDWGAVQHLVPAEATRNTTFQRA